MCSKPTWWLQIQKEYRSELVVHSFIVDVSAWHAERRATRSPTWNPDTSRFVRFVGLVGLVGLILTSPPCPGSGSAPQPQVVRRTPGLRHGTTVGRALRTSVASCTSCHAYLGCLLCLGAGNMHQQRPAWAIFAFAFATFLPSMHGGRATVARTHCR